MSYWYISLYNISSSRTACVTYCIILYCEIIFSEAVALIPTVTFSGTPLLPLPLFPSLNYFPFFLRSHESISLKKHMCLCMTIKFFLTYMAKVSFWHFNDTSTVWKWIRVVSHSKDTRCVKIPTDKSFFSMCKLSHTNLFWKTHMMINLVVSPKFHNIFCQNEHCSMLIFPNNIHLFGKLLSYINTDIMTNIFWLRACSRCLIHTYLFRGLQQIQSFFSILMHIKG